MTHVFIAPHPDDAALSCGGLIASLRELGQNVTIISVYSGGPAGDHELSGYQREALGFGSKVMWPAYESFKRTNISAEYEVVPDRRGNAPWKADTERIELTQERANTQARQFWQRSAWSRAANVTNQETDARPLSDSVAVQGSLDPIDFSAADVVALRKAEDERYAWFNTASVVFLDLPDAVYRGYEGDEQLLGSVREDDLPPYDLLRQEILRLEPQMVYFPLAVGNHVDHQLCREVGVAMLAEERRWVMPAPEMIDRLTFYEDFPYAWWHDFAGLDQLQTPLRLPNGVANEARYSDISEEMEQKAAGIRLYASQIHHLFDSDQRLLDDLWGYHTRVALAGGVEGQAERYWAAVRP
ncbi:MAG: PIG-L family deacetylase [Candidatus Limnocylindrales bacterium]